jgi:hypothetical protein
VRVDLDTLSAEQRRLLLVASDATYRALTERIDWRGIGKLTGAVLAPFALPGLLLGSALASSAYLAATWRGMSQRGARSPLVPRLRVGELPIPHVTPEEAGALFRFDPGDPEDGAAYVLSPWRRDYYLRPASANERLAQEKLAAFLQLTAALGARDVEVTGGEQLERRAFGFAPIPLQNVAAQLGLRAKVKNGGSVQRTAIAKFSRPLEAPRVPEALRPWVAAEPVLEGMAATRLSGSAEELGVALVFRDEIDVAARACLELGRKGLNIGGAYQRVHASEWAFRVRFWPLLAAPNER